MLTFSRSNNADLEVLFGAVDCTVNSSLDTGYV